MKILKKLAAGLLVSMAVVIAVPTGASAEWRFSSAGWWYSQGNSYATGWTQIDGAWYYFDSNGYMKTGWQLIDWSWYYFYFNGMMAEDTTVEGGAVGTDGKWISLSTYDSTHNAKAQLAEEESIRNFTGTTSEVTANNGVSDVQLKPDTKVIYDWYSESELEDKGISVDRSDLNFDFDVDDSDSGFNIITTVEGTLKLKNSSTNAVLKSIKFNDTLTSKDIKDGYYKVVKDGLTIRIGTDDDYDMDFSGDNLLSLGILK